MAIGAIGRIAGLGLLSMSVAHAQTTQNDVQADSAPAATSSLWQRDTLLGDMGGVRPALGKYGFTISATEVSEYLNNLRGGLKTGGAYDGLTTITLGADLEKTFALKGGSFNISMLQVHGHGLSDTHLGTINTASGLEAGASTRLWELWYEQTWDDKRFDLRVGQQSIDQEFLVSSYGQNFVGTTLGWPALPSYDLPLGGPTYPQAALGARLKTRLTPSISILAGVYDGNPIGNNPDNRSGTNFNLGGGTLFIGEWQYARHGGLASGGVNADATATKEGLPGTYKLGMWYHTASFADQNVDTLGRSLAAPDSSGVARSHRGDMSFYAMADQMIWRPNAASARSIGVFARIAGAPGDRNLISLSANMGIVMHAPFAARDNDSVGLALSYARVGAHVTDLDQQARALANGPYGVRSGEAVIEATYQFQVAPWWTIQADAQYSLNPGAGQNPLNPTLPLRDTVVIGVRTALVF